ncbi:hypothetical protein QEZ54_30005 [Catellatospora sp. KI3]|uniref:hypothetical protein n=1 Tax=Catellatospora sp. KI3 TaxID=3041620 RepID=UPI002482D090|nr:hypothetical protein [Catellatospora sp. KI3]MDI1465211.1 hypothetical protein [Catellatospora sp. KI3]
MSMHDVEDLVCDSILVLDAHHAQDDDRLRSWFTTLYAFQAGYDCSHTQGRVLDILLKRGHTYRLPVSAHPDYGQRREFLDGLADFTPLREFDADAEDFEGYGGELEDGYVDPPWLYCEAGTALWRRLVADGRLRGRDAAEPARTPLIDVVAEVAAAAERDGDLDLIAMWHGLGPDTLVERLTLSAEDLREIPAAVRLREIALRSGALSVELPDGYRPTDEELAVLDDDRETWWYAVDDVNGS